MLIPGVNQKIEMPDSLESETVDNTRRNSQSLKRIRDDASDSKIRRPDPVRVVKKRCCFGSWTQVCIVAEAEEEFLRTQSCPRFLFASWGDNAESMAETSAAQNEEYKEEFSRAQSCPGLLFASWGDNVENMVEPSSSPPQASCLRAEARAWWNPAKSTLRLLDLVETKQGDGPKAASLLVANLINDAVSATKKQFKMLKSHLSICNSHHTLDAEKFASVAPRLSVNKLEPTMMAEVYVRIQKIVIRVEQFGSIGLLPQAVRINTSHLPVLHYLLLKLHRAALAKLHTESD